MVVFRDKRRFIVHIKVFLFTIICTALTMPVCNNKGGITTRFDPPPNGLRELKLHRLSANGCTKRKIFLKIFCDIKFRS